MSAGWIDAEEWAQALAEHLSLRAAVYELEPDQALRRNKAAGMVGALVAFLKEVPGVCDSDVLPLKDLLIFAHDMDMGRRHPWSFPDAGGTNIESAARTEMRAWAIAAVLALQDAKVPVKASYERVAERFRKTGREVTWRGVQGWTREYKKKTDPRLDHVDQIRAKYWCNAVCSYAHLALECENSGHRGCIELTRMAEHFVGWASKIPHLRDKV